MAKLPGSTFFEEMEMENESFAASPLEETENWRNQVEMQNKQKPSYLGTSQKSTVNKNVSKKAKAPNFSSSGISPKMTDKKNLTKKSDARKSSTSDTPLKSTDNQIVTEKPDAPKSLVSGTSLKSNEKKIVIKESIAPKSLSSRVSPNLIHTKNDSENPDALKSLPSKITQVFTDKTSNKQIKVDSLPLGTSQKCTNEKNVKKQKKALYLGSSQKLTDRINLEKSGAIKIIKNGNRMNSSVKVNEKYYTMRNTCAFDSLLQAVVGAAVDNKNFDSFVLENETHKFFELVSSMKSGVKSYHYTQRGEILVPFYVDEKQPKKIANENATIVDCRAGIITTIVNVLNDFPSYKEVSTCQGGCAPRRKRMRIISMTLTDVVSPDFENHITDSILMYKTEQNCYKNCGSKELTKITELGKSILIFVCYKHKKILTQLIV